MAKKIKTVAGTEQKYSPYADRQLWASAREIAIYFLIFGSSGFMVKYFLDQHIAPGASEVGDKNFKKRLRFDKVTVGEGVYKNESQISDELAELKRLQPNAQLASKKFFKRGQCYFIQVIPDE